MTEEEWLRRESNVGQLLLTKDEWTKRSKSGGTEVSSISKNRSTGGSQGNRGARDRSRLRCFNCSAFGHFAYECQNPKRDKETKTEANLTQVHDDEPAILLTECSTEMGNTLLLNEVAVKSRLDKTEKSVDSNLWYLDNGASNHMTGQKSSFWELDEGVTGLVRFGDGSTVEIKGKRSVIFKWKTREDIIFKEVYFIPTLRSNINNLG